MKATSFDEIRVILRKTFCNTREGAGIKKICNKTKTFKSSFKIETNDIPSDTIKGKLGYPGNCRTEDKLF